MSTLRFLIIFLMPLSLDTVSAQTPIRGFAADAFAAQRALEARYDSGLSAQDMDGWMR